MIRVASGTGRPDKGGQHIISDFVSHTTPSVPGALYQRYSVILLYWHIDADKAVMPYRVLLCANMTTMYLVPAGITLRANGMYLVPGIIPRQSYRGMMCCLDLVHDVYSQHTR